MSNSSRPIVIATIAAASLLWLRFRDAIKAADDARPADVSRFAPAADLANELVALAGRLDELLAKPEDFDDARKSRVAKEANVAAVVALALALSDEQHPLRGSAAWGS